MRFFKMGFFENFSYISKSLTSRIYFSNFKMLPIIIIIHALLSIGYSKWIIIITISMDSKSHLKIPDRMKNLDFWKSQMDVIRWVCHMSMWNPRRDHRYVLLSHKKGCCFYIIIIRKEEYHLNCLQPTPWPFAKFTFHMHGLSLLRPFDPNINVKSYHQLKLPRNDLMQ